jgi:hypothetical protein
MAMMSKELKDIKKMLETQTVAQVAAAPTTAPTFAQIAATPPLENPPETPKGKKKRNTANDKIKKQQREKLTIKISAAAAPDATKNQMKSMHPQDLIQKCQSAIDDQIKEGRIPKIHGISKLSNDEYRLHCETEEDPPLLNAMNWDSAFEGAQVKKRKYGLVLHGVPKMDLDLTDKEDEVIIRDEIEEENTSRNLVGVIEVNPLKRTQKELDKISAHHSIVISTHNIDGANECLKRGMFIKGRYYSPEKYTPELNLIQCYKCFDFGHMAKHCECKKQKCGKCGEDDHEKDKCTNPIKCVGCGNPHPAWHKECSKRNNAGKKLEEQRKATSDSF